MERSTDPMVGSLSQKDSEGHFLMFSKLLILCIVMESKDRQAGFRIVQELMKVL